MILSLGFGLVAAIGISQLMKAKNLNATPPAQEMGTVMVASADINVKAVLDETCVKLENWPKAIIPEGVATSLEDITDMSTRERLSPGAPIFKDKLIHKNQKIEIDIPEGQKLVSVKVSAEDHFAGLLNPGDKVDVIGLFKRRKKDGTQQTMSRTFLKALQVFSINSRMTNDRGMENEPAANNGSVIVGVLVNEKQAEEIFFVQRTGTLKLVLRGEPTESDNDVEDLSDIMNMEDTESMLDEDGGPAPPRNAASQVVASPDSMIIFKGQMGEKYIVAQGDIPQKVATASVDNDGLGKPVPASEASRGFGDDDDDFNGSEENNRRIEEDQYRSQ